MPYEDDPVVIAWFHRALADRRAVVRRQATELLEFVDCEYREAWLLMSEQDSDLRVVAAAASVRAALTGHPERDCLELLESDFMDGTRAQDLEWEWEYSVKVCRSMSVPRVAVRVWTQREDDAAAKRMALMKAFPLQPAAIDAVAVIVGKHAVTRFTRSARSFAEAQRWHREGRPRYDGH